MCLDVFNKIKKYEGKVPDLAITDVKKRVNDWLSSGGNESDPYIHQQLRYLKMWEEEEKA